MISNSWSLFVAHTISHAFHRNWNHLNLLVPRSLLRGHAVIQGSTDRTRTREKWKLWPGPTAFKKVRTNADQDLRPDRFRTNKISNQFGPSGSRSKRSKWSVDPCLWLQHRLETYCLLYYIKIRKKYFYITLINN